MKAIFTIATIGILCISGCSTPGSRYANAHPELSLAHRRILVNGKMPAGTAVQGMTKEEVKIAIGAPAKTMKQNGQEVWVYTTGTSSLFVSDSDPNSVSNTMNLGNFENSPIPTQTTSIYFIGNRATFAKIEELHR